MALRSGRRDVAEIMKPSLTQLLLRDIRHYRRQMLTVVAAMTLAVAAITGALLTGASVKQSLFALLDFRLGQARNGVLVPQGTVRQDMLKSLERTAPLLQLDAYLSAPDQAAKSSRVFLYGVDQRFFQLAPLPSPTPRILPGQLLINRAAASLLELDIGDTVIVRLQKPGALSGDFMMASPEKELVSLRLEVAGVMSPEQFGDVSTENNQRQTPSCFAELGWLASQLGLPGRANLFLSAQADPHRLRQELIQNLALEDLDCTLEPLTEGCSILRSASGFLPEAVVQTAQSLPATVPAFTWFVNAIEAHGRSTPFSFVGGVPAVHSFVGGVPAFQSSVGGVPADQPSPDHRSAPSEANHAKSAILHSADLPSPLKDDEIAVVPWLAEDLALKPGDRLRLRYFVVGTGPDLTERTADFTVKDVLGEITPAEAPLRRALMPDFPGLKDAEDCSDWDADLPIDLQQVRPKDEVYWDRYRGSPKAFITLKRSRELWGSRFGNTTACLIPREETAQLLPALRASLASRQDLPGIQVRQLRAIGEKAATHSVDFSGLFVGLSFFFILSALILTGLMLAFFLDTRKPQIGIFRAVGFPDRTIRRFFLMETGLLVLPSIFLGTLLGIGWCSLILWGLNTIWLGAVGSTTLTLHLPAPGLTLAAAGSLALTLLTTTLITSRFLTRKIRELTDKDTPSIIDFKNARMLLFASLTLVLTGLTGAFLIPLEGDDAMGGFIGVGMTLLMGLIGILAVGLYRKPRPVTVSTLSMPALAWRNLSRRRERTLAVITLLALGVFLTVSVGINQKGTLRDPRNPQTGTGGFALYLETALPISQDLKDQKVRGKLGLALASRVLPFRMSAGSSADCQNLNQVLIPRIVACDPDILADRQAFTFKKHLPTKADSPWHLLHENDGETIPIVADMTSIAWILQKKLDETIDYQVDDRIVKLRLVGGLENSILQGNVVMSEPSFLKLFPTAAGYRLFLADSAPENHDSLAAEAARGMGRYGLSVEDAAQRLKGINLVQNTYLRIFLSLGALGVLLGVLGTALLMIRNLRERRGEFAWMKAAGFSQDRLAGMLQRENLALLGSGTAAGTLAAALVMIPVLRSPSGHVPWIALLAFYLSLCSGIILFSRLISRRAIRECNLADLTDD
jgi:ABC-type antimicrobial peptide transport system permease subunit